MSGVMRFNMIPAGQPNPSPSGLYVRHEDYDTLRTANQRLEAQRDAILLQARCWAGEAKAQQSVTKEVGEILGGVPDWGSISDSVAAIVADNQRLEGAVARLREALTDLLGCPASVVQTTVPKAGIEAAPPYQVVLDVSVSLTRWKKAEAALAGTGEEQ